MRHNIRGKRIVVEDASLVDLVRAHLETQHVMREIIRRISTATMFDGVDYKYDRTLARRYATALSIERDLVNELQKRACEKRWQ